MGGRVARVAEGVANATPSATLATLESIFATPVKKRHPLLELSEWPPRHPATQPVSHPATHPSCHSSTRPPSHLATHPPGHSSTRPPGHPATRPSINSKLSVVPSLFHTLLHTIFNNCDFIINIRNSLPNFFPLFPSLFPSLFLENAIHIHEASSQINFVDNLLR